MKIPTCAYLDRKMAYRVINEFITTKSIPRFKEWVDLYDIDFKYGF